MIISQKILTMFRREGFEMEVLADEVVEVEEVAAVEQFDREMMEERAIERMEYDQIRQEEIVDTLVEEQVAQDIVYDNYAIRQEEVVREEVRQEQFAEVVDAYAVGYGERQLIEQQEYERRKREEERQYRALQEGEYRQNEARLINNQVQQFEEAERFPAMQNTLKEEERVQANPIGKFESPLYYHHFFEWKEGVGCIGNGEVVIGDKAIRLSDLGKIKVNKELVINNSRKTKLSHLTGDLLFSVEPERTLNGLPLHYVWFAKVITEKLYLKGCDLGNPYVPERRFTNNHIKGPIIDGILYKQSQYLKTWELRNVAITADGLYSYKDEVGDESFTIKRDTATELWTRFDIHEKMLVIKVHHNSRKTEFGIPIVDYCRDSDINWLYAFYRLVFPI